MRPLDPRLLRYARRAAVPIGALAVLGAVTAALVIAQAWLLASAISSVFTDKSTLTGGLLAALALVFAGRALTAAASNATAARASAAAKTQLRARLLRHVIALGPRDLHEPGPAGTAGDADAGGSSPSGTAAVTQLATTGLDALDGYFTSYLPALVLAVAVPLSVLAVIAYADPVSGLVVAVTLPLVPVFGALIGMATGAEADRRWTALATLAHHFHDVVAGLTTLKVFGRERVQHAQIERVTGDYRRASMGTLRLAFLSGFALELIATMSVALVATETGLRLAYGHLGLHTALLVLILAPEAYLPLRNLGGHFHATADGLAAADKVFTLLARPAPFVHSTPATVPPAGVPAGSPAGGAVGAAPLVVVTGLSVRHEGRADPAPDRASLAIVPGRLTVLAGPSGCGKTTLLNCLLGFAEPSEGTLEFRPGPWLMSAPGPPSAAPGPVVIQNGSGVPSCPPGHLPGGGACGWVPQHPTFFAGTVADNIRLGWPDAPGDAVAAAVKAAALGDVPLDRVLGERGTGLSAGQRRRVALARALLPGRPLLLLDEPTAGLDPASEAAVVATLRAQAAAGVAVLAVSHRPALIAAADEVVTLGEPAGDVAPASPDAPAARPPGQAGRGAAAAGARP
jgi:ATP-binding cassette subfamily C protein CydCD